MPRLRSRRKTAADWTAENPVLWEGEFGWDQTNGILKLGDGVTPWNSLEPAFASTSVATPYKYGAAGDGATNDTAALAALFAAEDHIFIPPGTWRTTEWISLRSNQRVWGAGPTSIIYNDKTNGSTQKQACLLAGNLHPAAYSQFTTYDVADLAVGATMLTFDVPGDSANFSVGELVIVGSETLVADIPAHAQLTKVLEVGAGTIRIADPLIRAVAGATVYKIAGTDSTSGQTWRAIENVSVENLAFRGRSPLATKSGIYKGVFRNWWLDDIHHAWSGNAYAHVIVENLLGEFSGRLIECAMNSYDVTFRNIAPTFKAVGGLQAGETLVGPILIAERSGRVTIDGVNLDLDDRYTAAAQAMYLNGYDITVRRANIFHGGTQNQEAFGVPSSSHPGFPVENITIDDCILGVSSTHSRVGIVGSSATDPPRNVTVIGGQLIGAPTAESVWFQFGRGFGIPSVLDRTAKTFKVSSTAQFPNTSGYRRAS